jgi:molecular chaperone IbpA
MSYLTKYSASDIPALMKRINEHSIGMDQYLDKIFNFHETNSNYPPYNLIQINDSEVKLEIALAGFNKKELNVYTESGKLFIEGKKEEKNPEEQYYHRAVAQRSFTRSWTISDDTEVRSVEFADGLLTIILGKVIPEHHKRKDWF